MGLSISTILKSPKNNRASFLDKKENEIAEKAKEHEDLKESFAKEKEEIQKKLTQKEEEKVNLLEKSEANDKEKADHKARLQAIEKDSNGKCLWLHIK